jgi:ubiquitin-protein ligase
MATNNKDDVYFVLNKTITDETRKRLLKDVVDIVKNPLADQGIYYVHSDENMFVGYAMIIGPEDTPYAHGFYLFRLEFPYNYPHSPPRLTFMTDDRERTRFNPNLYVNGKVCLSILNTWEGDRWTSCQSIRSILMSLIMVLNDNPLTNEPGYYKHTHSEMINSYNIAIAYKNVESAICKMISRDILPNDFNSFYSIMKKYFVENYGKIREHTNKYLERNPSPVKYVFNDVYKGMEVIVNFKGVLDLLEEKLKQTI